MYNHVCAEGVALHNDNQIQIHYTWMDCCELLYRYSCSPENSSTVDTNNKIINKEALND